MTNRNIWSVRVKWIRVLKRGVCIKFESLKICIAGNQCDNCSDLDTHNAEDKKLAVFILCFDEGRDDCQQLKPKGSHASFAAAVTDGCNNSSYAFNCVQQSDCLNVLFFCTTRCVFL